MTQKQIRFGLMPIIDTALELPRTMLPLKSVRYHFVARGGMAEVEMTQVYCQENKQPIDCEYLFPLPADGAVYRCEATINGRIIRARIEEREAAKKIVAEKKAEGYRTALVESERDNLFTLSLGNIQPQDVVEVKLAYLQPLRRLGDHVTLDMPLCPGVRYIPGNTLLRSNRGSGIVDDTDQVPDASRITPPRIDAEHPDAAFIELEGQIEAEFLDGEVESPSHKVAAMRKGDMVHLTLAKGGEAPDRDLALRWKEREPDRTALRGWTSVENGNNYALLELRAPVSVESTDAIEQDVYFLVDRSGSMEGEKWQKAIQALYACVKVLGSKDRAMVTLFESTFNDFDAEPVSPVVLMADSRFVQLSSVSTGGSTDMEPALRHVLENVEKYSKDRPAVVVLITDAEIGNEREIISLMGQHPSLPVHCFGIDATLNDSMLLDLVRQQGGTFHALQPKDDVAGIVSRLGRTLRQPVLVNLQAPDGWELAARAIPNLYAGQIHLVSLRSKQSPAAESLKLKARDHRNAAVELEFNLVAVQESGPRLRWCKERLVNLVAKKDNSAAITLSKESNLLCLLTAFVAWDEEQKVAVASHTLIQPALAPSRVAGCGPVPPASFVRAQFVMPADYSPNLALNERPRAKSCARAPIRLKNNFLEKKKIVIKRIESMLNVLNLKTRDNDSENPLQELLAWVVQATDIDAIELVSQLLGSHELSMEVRVRFEQRLQKLTILLADEMGKVASSLRDAWSGTQNNPERLEQLKEAISLNSSDGIRNEMEAIIREIARLENQIRQSIEEFLRAHPNATTSPPSEKEKK